MRRRALGSFAFAVTACANSRSAADPAHPPAAASPPRPAPPEPDATAGEPDPCDPVGAVERVDVEVGTTAETRTRIAVTYHGLSHDSYDDGRTDAFVELSFRGIDDDGNLTPSELRWMPSMYAEPRFVYLQIGRCVRLVEATTQRASLEISRP